MVTDTEIYCWFLRVMMNRMTVAKQRYKCYL